MLAKRTLPFTLMSAGGTAAVWATVTAALFAGTPLTEFGNWVTIGCFDAAVCRCTTTSELDPLSVRTVLVATTFPPASVKVTVCVPAATWNGPTTFAVATLAASWSPSMATSIDVAGRPCTTYTVAAAAEVVWLDPDTAAPADGAATTMADAVARIATLVRIRTVMIFPPFPPPLRRLGELAVTHGTCTYAWHVNRTRPGTWRG